MPDLMQFGDPSRFAIAVRWAQDSELRARRPAAHGWSMGNLRLTVGGITITRSHDRGRSQDHVGWYLSPLFDWLATNWTHLLHEEDFSWREPTGLPAAPACRKALHRWIAAEDMTGMERYRAVQAWYRRHGLRAASEGGLFPDLFIRRLIDDAEVSWNAAPPVHAPDGFVFTAEAAQACLPIDDVAGPLWQALCWFRSTPPHDLDGSDRAAWETIARRIDALEGLSVAALEAPYLPPPFLEELRGRSARSTQAPAITEFSPAVAMFGGVSPDLSRSDVDSLLAILTQANGSESAALEELVLARGLSPLGIPHQDGYDFAQDFLDELGLPGGADWIDVEGIARHLGIAIQARSFDALDIRGIALAGTGIAPRIVVNTKSSYNTSSEGRRFTLAHEVCHILHDRSRARRVTHVSGPWVAQGFERRANAFAAFLLMPRTLILRHVGNRTAADPDTVRTVATALRVSESALVEHLFNLQIIDDEERERLRPMFRSRPD